MFGYSTHTWFIGGTFVGLVVVVNRTFVGLVVKNWFGLGGTGSSKTNKRSIKSRTAILKNLKKQVNKILSRS